MYCSAFDFLNSQRPQQQEGRQDEQQPFLSPVYPTPQSFPTTDFSYAQQNNRPITPLDATFPPSTNQQFFGDDLFQPVTEIVADQFLLPAFTTIYQGAPTDNQQQNSRLYSDFDTPQYANLVVPGSAVKQPQPTVNSTGQELQQHQPFASGLWSPFPATTSDFYYDSVQPYPANVPQPSPAPYNNIPTLPIGNIANNNELSLFGSGFFDQQQQPQQRYFPPPPHPSLQQDQHYVTTPFHHQDAAVDTCDLVTTDQNNNTTGQNNKRTIIPVGMLPSVEVPITVSLRPHKCGLCSSGFARAWTLRQHMASHVGVKIFYCPICGKSLARRQNVAYHLKKRHSLPTQAHWALSSGGIEDETALLQETMSRLEDGSLHCLTCTQVFRAGTGRNLLVAHARRHAASFCCMASNSCRKRFRSLEGLISHSSQDHFVQSDQQLDCSQCSASFTDWSGFQKHLIEHAKTNIRRINNVSANDSKRSLMKRQYKCLRCWKTFTTRLALSRHVQSDPHSYICTVEGCGRIFTDRRRLDAHNKLTHLPTATREQAAKFVCSTCKRSFTTPAGLTRHASRTHGVKSASGQPKATASKTRISCPFRDSATRPCGSMFDRQSQVDKHVKFYHRKRGHRKKKTPPGDAP